MKKSKIAKIISIIFVVMLVCGVGCLFFLPNLYDLFKINTEDFMTHSLLYRTTFYICYILCLVIIYQLMHIFNIIYESPFKKEVEMSLKVSATLFMTLSIIILVKALVIPTLLSFVVTLICFIASLSFYVLAEVIKSAIIYKKELEGVI